MVEGNIDILVGGETKLDDTFPVNQFALNGFSKPYRKDRNRHGGGVMIFVRDDIPSKSVNNHTFPDDIEAILVQINLKKYKFLLLGGYHPPSQSENYFFNSISMALDMYRDTHKNLLLTSDFNADEEMSTFGGFLEDSNLKNIVKDKTCFKNALNPSCIDLFLTNTPHCFQNTCTINTGLSDFHRMIPTIHKTTFRKAKPIVIQYRCYKNELEFKLSKSIDCKTYQDLYMEVLNRHAPLKKKTVRANQVPYMTRTLRKAIMMRSKLENNFLKNSTLENKIAYKKQKNLCSKLYKKERKNYYFTLNPRCITDNKLFWKTIKPFLTHKGETHKKITLIENGEILTEDKTVAETLNNFFSDAPKSLGIQENRYLLNSTTGLTDPVDRAIMKFQSHPSILQILENVPIYILVSKLFHCII